MASVATRVLPGLTLRAVLPTVALWHTMCWIPRVMRHPKTFLLVALVAAFAVLWTGSAFAQTVAINEGSIQRSTSFRSSSQNPLWISKSDCLVNDQIMFPLTVSNYGSYQLEVWAGSASDDCRTPEARRGTTAVCWQVWKGVPTSTGLEVMVSVRDIVSRNKPSEGGPTGPGSGTIDDCEWTEATTAPQEVALYFMFVDAGSDQQMGGAIWKTKFDLAGPTAPNSVSAGIGDTLVVVNWKESTDTDKAGYRFYCDPIPGKEGEQTNVETFDLDASLDGDLDANDGDAGDGGDTDAAIDAGDADTDADTEAGTEAGTDSGSTNTGSACPTNVLVASTAPNEAYYCGSGSGTSGKVSGLKNGVQYSIAVASVDGVGNVGKLSNVTCATPSPVDDFFKVYRDAGGQAGGGFCAVTGGVGHGAGIAGLLLVGLAALGSTIRRRRNR
ncbi:MAG: hypothetical protein CVU63_00285 [Deltaproteobacteria bacterium HGW-Deltaproteobacteria-20]|nr:MAG: hypothetical protein CVU63_00285 [Deltaproteobacteria bacterium HGW-Deltaproteobacteria-20]